MKKDPARVALGQVPELIRWIRSVEGSVFEAAALIARLAFAVGHLAAAAGALC